MAIADDTGVYVRHVEDDNADGCDVIAENDGEVHVP